MVRICAYSSTVSCDADIKCLSPSFQNVNISLLIASWNQILLLCLAQTSGPSFQIWTSWRLLGMSAIVVLCQRPFVIRAWHQPCAATCSFTTIWHDVDSGSAANTNRHCSFTIEAWFTLARLLFTICGTSGDWNKKLKMKDIWPKIGLYLIKYKEKWEETVKRSDERDEERERDDETENVMENN
jgi:hypothetical protein